MRNKILLLSVCMIVLSVSGCGASQTNTVPFQDTQKIETNKETPPDLNGEWIQSGSDDSGIQCATITDNTIEIYWLSDEDNTKALYWAGSFIAPTENTKKYEWDSVNDKTKTDSALLASSDDTKHFIYEDKKISYEVTAMGITKTVTLKKQN